MCYPLLFIGNMLYSRAVEGLNSNSPMRIALFLDRDDDLGIIFSEYGNYIRYMYNAHKIE